MIRRTWPAILMTLAMLAGIAHVTLHLAAVPDAHYSQVIKVDCALAAIDKCSAAAVALPGPPGAALSPAVAAPDALPLPRVATPWRARAPPVVV